MRPTLRSYLTILAVSVFALCIGLHADPPTTTIIPVTPAGTATLTNKTIAGGSNTLTVRLASDVTGVLPESNGGAPAAESAWDLNQVGISYLTIPDTTPTPIPAWTVSHDPSGIYSAGVVTPTRPGLYLMHAQTIFYGLATCRVTIGIRKNGTLLYQHDSTDNNGGYPEVAVTAVGWANGTTDYFDVQVEQTSGSSCSMGNDADIVTFSGVRSD